MFPPHLISHARTVITKAQAKGWRIATAESCTGGLGAALLTEIPGSSSAIDRGYVTYSNTSKTEMIHVTEATLTAHGAVSLQTAAEMAEGARQASGVDLAVSITGIAGPGGGSAEKPVGTVCFGLVSPRNPTVTTRHLFTGDRGSIRLQAVEQALILLSAALDA